MNRRSRRVRRVRGIRPRRLALKSENPQKWTLKSVADRLRLSQAGYSLIELAQRAPDVDVAMRISREFGVSVEEGFALVEVPR